MKETIKKWERVKGNFITPGGEPLYRCPYCNKGQHLHGIEFPRAYEYCPNCRKKINGYEY